MNEQTQNQNESSENATASGVTPEGHISVALKYNFRRFADTPENRAAQLPEVDGRTIEVSEELKTDADGKVVEPHEPVFKRKTEIYNLPVPTPEALGFTIDSESDDSKKQVKVLQNMITTLIEQYGRKLVNEGVMLTPNNCNWQIAASAEYERLQKVGTSSGGVTYSKELLEELAESFSDYMQSLGKPDDGIQVMVKMIKGRFNVLSTRKYIKGLDMVRDNLEQWYANHLTEEEQEENKEVTIYLLERLEAAKEPELVDTGSLF